MSSFRLSGTALLKNYDVLKTDLEFYLVFLFQVVPELDSAKKIQFINCLLVTSDRNTNKQNLNKTE